MGAAAMSPMIVNLTPKQRTRLRERAKNTQQPVAAIVRAAIDEHLSKAEHISAEQMQMLDAATKRAQEDVEAILTMFDELKTGHRRFLKELAAIRKERR
jgi:predicted DNA-binding protein